jgi:hypothetical protein
MAKAKHGAPCIGSGFGDCLEAEDIAAEVAERAARGLIAHLARNLGNRLYETHRQL